MICSGILFGFFFVYPLSIKLRWTVRVHTSRLSCKSFLRSLSLYSGCGGPVCVRDARFDLLIFFGSPTSFLLFERFVFLELLEISVLCFLFHPSLTEHFLDISKSGMEENGECFFGVFVALHGDVIESWVTFGVYFYARELAAKNATCCYSWYQ